MIIHIWSAYQPDDIDTQRRHLLAQSTWAKQPWTDRPIRNKEFWRLWRENGKTVPYIRDLFDAGCKDQNESTIICFTNADIIVRSDATFQIVAAMQETDAAYSYRFDFHHQLDKVPSDSAFTKGIMYPGSDLFVFRVYWWKKHRNAMPDMLIAHEGYDPVLRTLIDESCKGTAPNEIVGICAHEKHGGPKHWENPANRYRLKGQQLNLTLAKRFFRQHGVNPLEHGIP